MGRKLQPLPPHVATLPKKNVAKILERREVVLQLMLAGADVRQIRAHLKEQYDVGLDTVEDDMRAMQAELVRHYEATRDDMIAMTAAQFDRIAMEQLQVAQSAKRDGEQATRLEALRDERKTRKEKLDLMGLTAQQVQVTGAIAHGVVAVDPAQMAAFVRSLEHAHLSPADAVKLLEA